MYFLSILMIVTSTCCRLMLRDCSMIQMGSQKAFSITRDLAMSGCVVNIQSITYCSDLLKNVNNGDAVNWQLFSSLHLVPCIINLNIVSEIVHSMSHALTVVIALMTFRGMITDKISTIFGLPIRRHRLSLETQHLLWALEATRQKLAHGTCQVALHPAFISVSP
jgi:hypothetical protein